MKTRTETAEYDPIKLVGIRCPQSLIDRIDAYAESGPDDGTLRGQRSSAARRLIERGLAVVERGRRGKDPGKVCAAQSPMPGRSYCYCTLARGHAGQHVAEATTGEVVSRWSEESE